MTFTNDYFVGILYSYILNSKNKNLGWEIPL